MNDIGMGFGFFCELLWKDLTEEASCGKGEKEKRDQRDCSERNIDAVRERPEKISEFSPCKDWEKKKKGEKKCQIEAEKL